MAFCTIEDMQDILSNAGVQNRIDDNENGRNSTNELAVADVMIGYAENRIRYFLAKKYLLATMESSAYITYCCAFIAVKKLCMRRANGVPESIEAEVDDIEETLKEIKAGKGVLPDVPPDTNSGIPSIINGTIRMGHRNIFRKDLVISTEEDSTSNNKFPDNLNRRFP